jgi:uncharacterized damage-inducible protein DinB
MSSKLELTIQSLDHAYEVFKDNLRGLTLEEALFVPQGGYRSVLGTLKHAAGWSHVYCSYAFDSRPKHWNQIDWPHGLRDTISKTEHYLRDVILLFDEAHRKWMANLSSLNDDQLDERRPLHWGQQAPLHEIVLLIATHHIYHAGELNQLLSIHRGEAWEETEEVEENHISTLGHRVRPSWMDE